MLIKSCLILVLLLIPFTTHAFTYEWDRVKDSVSFDIEQASLILQSDGHYLLTPWTVTKAGILVSNCTKTKCSIIIPAINPPTFFRITTYFSTGVKNVRTYSGAWYGADWLSPGTAGSAEIK